MIGLVSCLRQVRLRIPSRTERTDARITGILDLVVSQAVPVATGVIVTLCTAGILGPAGRGTLTFVMSSASLLGILVQASVYVGAVHGHRKGDTESLQSGLAVSVLLALSLVAGAVVAVLLVPRFRVGQLNPASALMVCVGAALSIVAWYLIRSLQAIGESRAFRDITTLQSVVYLVVAVSAAALWRRSSPVVAVWLFAQFLPIPLAARRLSPWISWRLFRRGWRIDLLKSALSAHVGFAGQQLLLRADLFVLGIFGTGAEVGYYSVAVFLAEVVLRLAEAFALAAAAEGAKAFSAETRRALRRSLIRKYLRVAIVLAVPTAVTAISILPWVLPAYKPSVPLVLLLLPGAVASGVARIELSSMTAGDERRRLVLAGGVFAAMSLAYVPLVLLWQALGAALGSTILYSIQLCCCALLVRGVDRHTAGCAAPGPVDGRPSLPEAVGIPVSRNSAAAGAGIGTPRAAYSLPGDDGREVLR